MKPESEATAKDQPTIGVAAGLGVVTSLVGIGASVARSKVTALFLGPAGVGMAAEIQQLATLALVPLAALSGPALHQALARERAGGLPPRATASALSWSLVVGLALGALATLGSGLFLPSEWGADKRLLVALSCVGLIATGLSNVATSMLVFDGKLGTTARFQVSTAGLSAVLVGGMTAILGLTGQFLAFAATPCLLIPWLIRSASGSSLWPRKPRLTLDRGFLVDALRIGASSLVAASALQAVLFSIRWNLEGVGGPELNGQFQASWAIGSLYLSAVLGGVATFAFPRYAAAATTESLQREVDSTARFVVSLAPPIVILATAYADIGVRLLYSDKFDTAIDILKWQLAGDVAKALSWVYAGPLLFRSRVAAYVVTELIAAAVFGVSSFALLRSHGAVGVGQAYFLTYALYLPLTAVMLQTSLGVGVRTLHVMPVVVTTGALGGVAWLVDHSLSYRLAASALSVYLLWKRGVIASVLAAVRLKLKMVRRDSSH